MATNNESSWGAVAGAATQALGNYAVQVASNKRQFKYQKEAMAIQQQYNQEMWDRQNAYNTPQAQMERLAAAGLNPRLMYGGNSAGTGLAGPLQAPDVPSRRASTAEIPDVFGRHLIARQADAQYAATMQNIESNQVKNELTQVRIGLENLKLMREGLRSKNYEQLNQAEKRTAQFVAAQSEQLFYNQQAQGNLSKQLYDQREKLNPIQVSKDTLDRDFAKNRNELADFGIYQSDHPFFRALIQASQRMGIPLDQLLERGVSALQYLNPLR